MTLIAGVGINDADYPVTKTEKKAGKSIQVWICPYYSLWKSMIHRCYGTKQGRYERISVCDEWLRFSNFEKWVISQKRTEPLEFYSLDKDLLGKNSFVYGPDFCCLIPCGLNSMLTLRDGSRGKTPVGVDFLAKKSKYRSQISVLGRRKHIGLFDTAEKAHIAWQKEKIKALEEYLLGVTLDDPRVISGLVRVRDNIYHDIKSGKQTESLFEERKIV